MHTLSSPEYYTFSFKDFCKFFSEKIKMVLERNFKVSKQPKFAFCQSNMIENMQL